MYMINLTIDWGIFSKTIKLLSLTITEKDFCLKNKITMPEFRGQNHIQEARIRLKEKAILYLRLNLLAKPVCKHRNFAER